MANYIFDIKEQKVSLTEWTWVAEERGTAHVIPLPEGGLEVDGANRTGIYPEIEKHLSAQHGINVTLAYNQGVDNRQPGPNGDTWTYPRGADVIIVNDIPRVLSSITKHF